ncbi:hypothetical protein [Atopobacter phocae]|uniref:hypothetical protein n=1 Tax=Atopobacter phocae TaxID=136492 RepID=UPI00046F03A1|nr:hypothetical protein [Atopobacter phocae]
MEYVVLALSELLSYENETVEEKLKSSFSEFKCERELDLEDFLVNKAILYDNTNLGKTYLIVEEKPLVQKAEIKIMAFFTIGQTSIDISEMSKNKKKKLLGNIPGRDKKESYFAFLIGQLGRSDQYSKENITGEVILNECYTRLKEAQKITGGRMLILECRKNMYDKFYKHKGFHKLYPELDDNELYTLYQRLN